MTEIDYGATRVALRAREAKAQKLARAAWDQGLHAVDITGLQHDLRLRISRIACVNPPGDESPTWVSVIALLTRMEAFAQQNPDHPRAHRDQAERRHEWVAPSVPLVPIDQAPRGWDQQVAAGPVPDRWCQIGDCGRPAVHRTPYQGNGERWRCAGHPPTGLDWGVGLNFTPSSTGCRAPRHCYCGRCDG